MRRRVGNSDCLKQQSRMRGAATALLCLRRARQALGQSRTFSTAPRPPIDLPCGPGTLLRVLASSSPVEVKARTGVEVAHLQAPAGSGWSWIHHPGSGPVGPVVDVKEAVGSRSGALQVVIPDKWVSVEVQSAGQPVSVSKVVEANVTVDSRGGDVTLGQVRAFSVEVDTRGSHRCGTLEGGEVSGSDVSLSTGRAGLTLQRLVGQRVKVEVEGWPLSVRALYAENINANTGGGAIDLGNLDVSELASLASKGGDVTVHSLDGNASLASAGGRIEVHLHSKVGSVQLSSGGGDVRVAVSPQALVAVVIKGKAPVTCSDAAEEQDGETGERVYHFRPSSDQQPTRYGQLSEGRVVVESGGGTVEVVRVGWMEALKQRLNSTPAS